MKLLDKNRLIGTSRVDHADWNYRPGLAYVMRKRFALALSLFPRARVQKVLEAGFGSGIFMPELAARSREVYGIDVHDRVSDVESLLRRSGIIAHLSRQDAAELNFPDNYFDLAVAISAIEFVDNIHGAVRELARILKPDGSLIVVMPAQSAILDFLLHVLTGESARADYGDRRSRVMPALLQHFRIARIEAFPRFFPVYRAWELTKR